MRPIFGSDMWTFCGAVQKTNSASGYYIKLATHICAQLYESANKSLSDAADVYLFFFFFFDPSKSTTLLIVCALVESGTAFCFASCNLR